MLLMEIRLPLLLFAACRNYAEPQRQEPKRVSCIIPPASLHRRAAHLVQTPPVANRNSVPAALGQGLGSGDVPALHSEALRAQSPAMGVLAGGSPMPVPEIYNTINWVN